MVRIDPRMAPGAYKTYQVLAPLASHFVAATCEESGCGAFLYGWVTEVDESVGLGQRQAHYVRREAGRRFAEERLPSGLTRFTFEAGQECFQRGGHRRSVGRPNIFVVRDGDRRQNPTGRRRVHASAEDWAEDFGEHQQGLAEAAQQG